MAYLLGIDVGTSGTKGVVYDEKGKSIAQALEEYPLHQPHSGWAEQNPEDWWQATVKVIQKLVQQIGKKSITGIGLSGQMHGSVFLDNDQQVIRPCILWCDQRTDGECRDILRTLGQDKLSDYTCNTALAGFTAPKVLWLRKNEPRNYERVATILLPKDYIRFLLTGEIATEVSDAAGTLMFDVKKRKWSKNFLSAMKIEESFMPPCYESIDICGKITAKVAQLTGLKEGTPVVGGGADNTCGAIGTGIIREGRVLASLGTSGVIFCHTDKVKVDPKQRIHSFCHSVPNAWYLMGCMLSAGGSFRWLRDSIGKEEVSKAKKMGVDPYEILTREAEDIPGGSEGLIFLPYLMGERSPHGDPNAKGVFFGLTARHNKAHLIRSVLEGVTFAMRDSLEIMQELGEGLEEIRATGGGARSELWRQIMADIFHRPINIINSSEGPAFGAAILAGVGTGVYGSISEAVDGIVKIVDTTEPNQERGQYYDEVYEIFRGLYPALKRHFKRLSLLVNRKP